MKNRAFLFLAVVTCIALATCSGASAPQPLKAVLVNSDSIKVPASSRYQKPGILRQLFIGSNYRNEWGIPVTMAIFHLREKGMTIQELGGGQQTKSLRLKDKAGKEWVLRTVDKDVEKALPPKLRNTLAEGVVQDLISAAYPYAPLVVARLSQAAAVPAPAPSLYYVPDDPSFGPYQSLFAHRICFLEERDPTIDGSESLNSENIQKKLGTDNQALILQQEVLRARLLDMLIADWDRHADQWRWGKKDSAGATYFYAIPRDRDQAFFSAGGLIPRVGKAVAMQHLNWFKKEMTGLSKLNFKSRDFDRIYLNDLDEKEWENTTRNFISLIADPVIEEAVAKMPAAVVDMSGKEIAARLKSRRASMLQPVLRYYRQIAREVQVWGTNEQELFALSNENGKLRVQVYALTQQGSKGLLRYDRVFDDKVTKVLHLEGLGGADRFEITSLPEHYPNLHLYGNAAEAVFETPQGKHKKIRIHAVKATAANNKEDNRANTKN